MNFQDHFASKSICFGCGPANDKGLRIKSEATGESADCEVVAAWTPEPHHEAFPGVLNGGIVGSLLDCHMNWTAAWHLMKKTSADHPPCTVTAEYSVKLLRPTPSKVPVRLVARVVESTDDRAVVEGALSSGGKVCATCRGIFVAVKSGHPAYFRW
ncbi:MAG: PaaI family thioesterase [Bdellovibrionota bacterium]